MVQNESLEPDLFGGLIALHAAASPMPPLPRVKAPESKTGEAFKTISETAVMLGLPQHVLRFWESKFPQLKPLKLKGGRRYYRPHDIESLFTIKQLLYKDGYTIKGARRAISHLRKQKGADMDEAGKPKKSRRKPAMDDAPLFAALMPAPAAPEPPFSPQAPGRKREELAKIHQELLQLRDLVHALPPLAEA